jgi:hypothetical protein
MFHPNSAIPIKTPGSAMSKKAVNVAITPIAGDSRKKRTMEKIATAINTT